jgi:hypothetical protein
MNRPYKTDERLALLEEAARQGGFSSRLSERERHKVACYLYDNSLIKTGGRGYIATDRGRAYLALWRSLPEAPEAVYRARSGRIQPTFP